MAKGSIAKEAIFKKMLEIFPNSFMADAKTLRIPWEENGETIEIKVALTAAKDILGSSVDMNWEDGGGTEKVPAAAPKAPVSSEPTAEEKANVEKLMASLGLI